jgi:hypothetical protein
MARDVETQKTTATFGATLQDGLGRAHYYKMIRRSHSCMTFGEVAFFSPFPSSQVSLLRPIYKAT